MRLNLSMMVIASL